MTDAFIDACRGASMELGAERPVTVRGRPYRSDGLVGVLLAGDEALLFRESDVLTAHPCGGGYEVSLRPEARVVVRVQAEVSARDWNDSGFVAFLQNKPKSPDDKKLEACLQRAVDEHTACQERNRKLFGPGEPVLEWMLEDCDAQLGRDLVRCVWGDSIFSLAAAAAAQVLDRYSLALGLRAP